MSVLKAGLVQWFDADKGFGIIENAEEGEFFLHISNIDQSSTDQKPRPGLVLVFKETLQRKKKAARRVHTPLSYMDFKAVLGYMNQSKVGVKIGREYSRYSGYSDRIVYLDLSKNGLEIIRKNVSERTFNKYIKDYYIEKIRDKTPTLFIPFCRLIESTINTQEINSNAFQDCVIFFKENLKGTILFEAWKEKQFKFVGLGANLKQKDDYVIPESILWKNKEQLNPVHLIRIKEYDFGLSFCKKYILWLLDFFEQKVISNLKEIVFYEVIQLIKEDEEYSKIVEKVNKLVFELAFDYLKTDIEGKKEEDNYYQITNTLNNIPENYPPTVVEKIRNEIGHVLKNKFSKEIVFRLWKDRYIQDIEYETIVEAFFKENYIDGQFKIFHLLKSTEDRINLINNLCKDDKWELAYSLLEKYIKAANTFEYNFLLKSKLYEIEFWQGKVAKVLVDNFINQLEKQSSPEKLTKLFLLGYIKDFSKDYVFATLENYHLSEIKKFISVSEEDLKFKFLKKLIELHQIDYSELVGILGAGIEFLTESKFTLLDTFCFDTIKIDLYYRLWIVKKGEIIPKEYLLSLFNENLSSFDEIKKWIEKDLITENKVAILLFEKLQKFSEIKDRKEFYSVHNLIAKIFEYGDDTLAWCANIKALNNDFFIVILWYLEKEDSFNFDVLKRKFIYFEPENQTLILKKLFKHHKEGSFDLTIEKLLEIRTVTLDIYQLNNEFNPDVPLDLTSDLIIESIKSFKEKGAFLPLSELLTIVLRNMVGDETRTFEFKHFFEMCPGRMEGSFHLYANSGKISKVTFGNGQFYFKIEFEYNEKLIGQVKSIPGSRWNNEDRHWGVPSRYEDEVFTFARKNNFKIETDKNIYSNNTHLTSFSIGSVPSGITFCNGSLAKKEHFKFKRKFWWCNNQACFQNCETKHEVSEWKKYTLLDFCYILGFNLEENSEYGIWPNGQYFKYITVINRFKRLLERLYCRGCNHILRPYRTSNYAAYSVVRFSCQNDTCKERNKVVYLNHCLNGKCNSIIDSRDTCKCSYHSYPDYDGLYICTSCGSCCSHDMLSRRLNTLNTTGGRIHNALPVKVNEKLGHLERAEFHCFKCSEEMTEVGTELFKCFDCNTEYDLSLYKYEFPHKHLRRPGYPKA